MTSTMMNIPKTLNVGYQERGGTYTGKLAYVVYTDVKGKLRKEASWTSWCSDKIQKDEFSNDPTDGFVLNKGVGGARESYGWNARNEYIRVYDSQRDFEFEISVANLLFILQECSSIKGKGLEGEFVYAWDRADLVLLPCISKEYQECVKFSENQATKVTKKDMIEGCTYQMRNMVNTMYLGRHDWNSKEYNYITNGKRHYLKSQGKKHIFLNLDHEGYEPDYVIESGFTKVAKRTSDEAVADYADAYETVINSVHCLLPNSVKLSKVKIKNLNFYRGFPCFIKKDNLYYPSILGYTNGYRNSSEQKYVVVSSKSPFKLPVINKNQSVSINDFEFESYDYWNGFREDNLSENKESVEHIDGPERLQEKVFYVPALVNEKGGSYNLLYDKTDVISIEESEEEYAEEFEDDLVH